MWVLALLICTTFLTPLCTQNLDTKQLIATDANTITVSTADELLAIATNNATNNGYSGKTIKVLNDITFEGTWTSIGTSSVPFVGTFDGGGYTITINNSNAIDGLFCQVGSGAQIMNIQFKGDGPTANFAYKWASLIRYATGTNSNTILIKNCVNYASIRPSLSSGVGGIVGEASYTIIESCANFGNIYSCDYTGGIVGKSTNVTVNNCYNFGSITSHTGNSAVAYGIGGDTVTNSYVNCTLALESTDLIRRICAISNGTNKNCYYGADTKFYIDGSVTTSISDSAKVTKVTDGADLYAKAFAAGWDFAKTWVYDTTDENKNVNGYPQLRGLVEQIISVTIDLNGGEYSGETTIVKTDSETCELPTNITRKGYTFKGYTVTSNSGTGSVSGTTYTFGESAGTIQAQWEINIYTITYNLNGGEMLGQKTTYTVETETFALPTPTRAKYKFVGWTGSNGTTKQASVTITKGTIGNLTYTANWESTVTVITIDVTVSNDREYIIYLLDASGEPTRQFVVKDTTKLNIEVDKGTTFSVMVYETLYLRSTIDGIETRKVEYKNIQNDSLSITLKLMGANNVNNWLVI